MREEHDRARIEQEFTELLDEVRVAIPGAEVLFAFLLGVAFTERFATLDGLQQSVYFATLLLTAGSIALLIAPTAYHRVRFRQGDKARLLIAGTRMALASLALLLLAIVGTVHLVANLLYSSRFAAASSAFVATWFLWFWFGLPLIRRVQDGEGTTKP